MLEVFDCFRRFYVRSAYAVILPATAVLRHRLIFAPFSEVSFRILTCLYLYSTLPHGPKIRNLTELQLKIDLILKGGAFSHTPLLFQLPGRLGPESLVGEFGLKVRIESGVLTQKHRFRTYGSELRSDSIDRFKCLFIQGGDCPILVCAVFVISTFSSSSTLGWSKLWCELLLAGERRFGLSRSAPRSVQERGLVVAVRSLRTGFGWDHSLSSPSAECRIYLQTWQRAICLQVLGFQSKDWFRTAWIQSAMAINCPDSCGFSLTPANWRQCHAERYKNFGIVQETMLGWFCYV